MKIRLIVFTLLCIFVVMGNIGCASEPGAESKTGIKSNSTSNVLQTGWYYIVDKGTEGAVEKNLDREQGIYSLDPQPILTVEHIKDAYFSTGFNAKGVQMDLTEKGTDRWADATGKSVRKYLAFVYDDALITVQRVAAPNLSGKTIFYKKPYSEEEMQAVINKLTAGKTAGGK